MLPFATATIRLQFVIFSQILLTGKILIINLITNITVNQNGISAIETVWHEILLRHMTGLLKQQRSQKNLKRSKQF